MSHRLPLYFINSCFLCRWVLALDISKDALNKFCMGSSPKDVEYVVLESIIETREENDSIINVSQPRAQLALKFISQCAPNVVQ